MQDCKQLMAFVALKQISVYTADPGSFPLNLLGRMLAADSDDFSRLALRHWLLA